MRGQFLYYPLQLLGEHGHRGALHLQPIVDVVFAGGGVLTVTGAGHDAARADLRLAEHREVGMAEAVKVKVLHTVLTDFLALVGKGPPYMYRPFGWVQMICTRRPGAG